MIDSVGSLMVDIDGAELSAEDIDIFNNPLVGGLILFARNYRSQDQIAELCAGIREIAGRPILIAVDHEGGRVQRFGAPFTPIPPMRNLGNLYDRDPDAAIRLTRGVGQLIAAELTSVDIDFSFTPVLDIGRDVSQVIGDRAFHQSPDVIAILAGALVDGLRDLGMSAVGKHFPGHGAVAVDSHVGLPVDERATDIILNSDAAPFKALVEAGISAVMPAHVVYSFADRQPAGFSKFWLQTVLRDQLGFGGAVFSDDLSMEAALAGGDIVERSHAAAEAGCDMLLVCNNRGAVKNLLAEYRDEHKSADRDQRLTAMCRNDVNADFDDAHWQTIRDRLSALSKQ